IDGAEDSHADSDRDSRMNDRQVKFALTRTVSAVIKWTLPCQEWCVQPMDSPAMSLETTDRLPEHWRVATELERRIRESSQPETVFLWCDLTFKVEDQTRRKRARQP